MIPSVTVSNGYASSFCDDDATGVNGDTANIKYDTLAILTQDSAPEEEVDCLTNNDNNLLVYNSIGSDLSDDSLEGLDDISYHDLEEMIVNEREGIKKLLMFKTINDYQHNNAIFLIDNQEKIREKG